MTADLTALPQGWHMTWSCSKPPAKLGYSGVALLSRSPPLRTGTGLITPTTPATELGCGGESLSRQADAMEGPPLRLLCKLQALNRKPPAHAS